MTEFLIPFSSKKKAIVQSFKPFLGLQFKQDELESVEELSEVCSQIVLKKLVFCEGCLVVITDHGPQAEVARALGHELLVDSGEGRLESLEEERQKREEQGDG